MIYNSSAGKRVERRSPLAFRPFRINFTRNQNAVHSSSGVFHSKQDVCYAVALQIHKYPCKAVKISIVRSGLADGRCDSNLEVSQPICADSDSASQCNELDYSLILRASGFKLFAC